MNEVKFMGTFPSHIKTEDLFLYFLYAFDYTWNLDAFDEIEDLAEYFEDSLAELIGNNESTPVQDWWGWCLILLKRVARQGRLTYALETLNTIGNKWFEYSGDELEEIINLSEASMHTELGELVVVRPLEYVALKTNLTDSDFGGMSLLEQKEEVLALLKKNLKIKDINKEILEENSYLYPSEFKKFSSVYGIVLEFYIGYFLAFSAAGKIIVSKENVNLETEMRLLCEHFFKAITHEGTKCEGVVKAISAFHYNILMEKVSG